MIIPYVAIYLGIFSFEFSLAATILSYVCTQMMEVTDQITKLPNQPHTLYSCMDT